MSYRKPHRVRRKKSIIKNRFFWSGFFTFVFLAVAIYFLFFSDFFEIEKIIISGNKKVSKEEIKILAQGGLSEKRLFFPPNNIFLANLKKIREDILSIFPQLEELEIKRIFPQSLNLTVIERRGVALICRSHELFTKDETKVSYEKCFLLDKEGIVFEEALEDKFYLPKLKNPTFKDELELGEKVLERTLLLSALDIFSGFEGLKIPIREVLIVSDERINVKTLDNWEIYFNPKNDLGWQLTKLKAVLEKDIPLERRGDLEYIELRFGNLAPFKYREIEE